MCFRAPSQLAWGASPGSSAGLPEGPSDQAWPGAPRRSGEGKGLDGALGDPWMELWVVPSLWRAVRVGLHEGPCAMTQKFHFNTVKQAGLGFEKGAHSWKPGEVGSQPCRGRRWAVGKGVWGPLD